MMIGIFPIISITAKRTIPAVNTSFKSKFIAFNLYRKSTLILDDLSSLNANNTGEELSLIR